MSGSSSTSITRALAPSPFPAVTIDRNANPRCLTVQLYGQIGQGLLDEVGGRERERAELECGYEGVDVALPTQLADLVLAPASGHGPEYLERRSLDRRRW